MTNNPFSSEIFSSIWSQCFGKEREQIRGVTGLQFYKGLSGVYINTGKTHTKGVHYALENDIELKGKTCLIYDVPTYFGCPSAPVVTSQVRLLKIRQYPGFLIKLGQFTTLNEYLAQQFKKSSRYKLNKYFRRLKQCFDIESTMYTGELPQEEYDSIFRKFRELLEKRFQEKGEHNNNLDESEWNFYQQVASPMIKNGKAGLFVIADKGEPIAITLTYFNEDIIFDAITVFDTDYSKFHLGSINIMMLIEWGINNKFKILDFSKGYFDYKVRWATQRYDFEYHILYDPKSPISQLRAHGIASFFRLKQYLREKNLNLFWNKLIFLFRKKERESSTKTGAGDRTIVFKDSEIQDSSNLVKIDGYHPHVIRLFFEFLYLNNEDAKNVSVFHISHGQYLFQGKTTAKIGSVT